LKAFSPSQRFGLKASKKKKICRSDKVSPDISFLAKVRQMLERLNAN